MIDETVPDSLRVLGTHDEIVLDGTRQLKYAEYGDRSGRPVVVLSGTPGSRWFGALYHDAARETGRRVISPDRPGYGGSAFVSGLTYDDVAADVVTLASRLDVDVFDVIAFSGGTPSALAVAERAPDRLGTVHLLSPVAPPGNPMSARRDYRLLFALGRYAPWLLSPVARVVAAGATRQSPAELARSYTDAAVLDEQVAEDATVADVFAADFAGAFARGVDGAVRELNLVTRDWGIDEESLAVPVTCWHGDADEEIPLAAARDLADDLPNCDLRVRPGEAHGEVPVRTRTAVLDE